MAQAAEVDQLRADRDALLGKTEAHHAQCLQQLADLEALRQELAVAHEGMTAASVDRRPEHFKSVAAIDRVTLHRVNSHPALTRYL